MSWRGRLGAAISALALVLLAAVPASANPDAISPDQAAAGSGVEPGSEPGVEPGAGPDADPAAEPDVEPGAGPDADPAAEPARIAGQDRIDTASRIAEQARPVAPVAVLARADDFADALPAAGLAGRLGAPVLLTWPDRLPDRTATTLDTLGIRTVLLLGGAAAVTPAVVDALRAGGRDVQRVAGPDRYGTAVEVARRMAALAPPGTLDALATAFLASGQSFAGALLAGPAAASHNQPVLLTEPGRLPPVTAAALTELGIRQVVVVGDAVAVSDTVAAELAAAGYALHRVAGPGSAGTAAAVADLLVDRYGYDPATVALARGDTFADALAVGAPAGARRTPLLLTDAPHVLADPTRAWLAGRCPGVATIQVIGGQAAVGEAVHAAAQAAARSCLARARVTYQIGTAGQVVADVGEFAAVTAATLADPRGWSLGGDLAFDQVTGGADLQVLLAAPAAVDAAASVCSAAYSCRVGDRVYINERRWLESTETFRQAGRTLSEYRSYVLNHEIGHWLALGHRGCPARGAPAPVMQQQSIRLDGCSTSVWPLPEELQAVRVRLLP